MILKKVSIALLIMAILISFGCENPAENKATLGTIANINCVKGSADGEFTISWDKYSTGVIFGYYIYLNDVKLNSSYNSGATYTTKEAVKVGDVIKVEAIDELMAVVASGSFTVATLEEPKTEEETPTYTLEDFVGKWYLGTTRYYEIKTGGAGAYVGGLYPITVNSVKLSEDKKNIVINKTDDLGTKDITFVITKTDGATTLVDGSSVYLAKDAKINAGVTFVDPVAKEIPAKYNAPTGKCNTYLDPTDPEKKKTIKAIDLDWSNSKPSTDTVVAKSYTVYRSESSSSVGTRLYAGTTKTTYQDSTVVVGKTYYYSIVPRSADGDGPSSEKLMIKCE